MCGVGSGSHNHPLHFPRVFGCVGCVPVDVGRGELVEVNLILHFYPGPGHARDAGLAQYYVNNLAACTLHCTPSISTLVDVFDDYNSSLPSLLFCVDISV